MQKHVDNALHDKVLAKQRLHPDKAAKRQHAHLQLGQAAITAKYRAVAKTVVVKHQAILQTHAINNTDGQQAGDDSQRPEQFCLLHCLFG